MSTTEGVAVAGLVVKIDDQVVAKIREINWTNTIEKQDVSGSEDTEGTSPTKITRIKAIPISREVTGECSGIYIADDTGQSDFRTAAENGDTVDIEWTDQRGYGKTGTGFFESFNITGSLQNVYEFTGAFHINSDEDVQPAS